MLALSAILAFADESPHRVDNIDVRAIRIYKGIG